MIEDIFYLVWEMFSLIFILLGAMLVFFFTAPIWLFDSTFNINNFFDDNIYFLVGLISYLILLSKFGIFKFPSFSVNNSENGKIEVFSYDFKSEFPKVVITKTGINKLTNLVIYEPDPYPQPTEKFFCQIDNDYHIPETKVFICSKCERYVCDSCYQVSKEAGMNKCPYCYSQLHKCETKKEKMKESHTLLTKMKDGYKEIIFAKEIEIKRN